ncbi:MAG: LamG domain-containing protein, partial [Candidatus Korobacteraceae bacterium]
MTTVPRWGSSALSLPVDASGYVDCGTFPGFDFGGSQSFTLEAWIYPQSSPSGEFVIISRWDTVQGSEFKLSIYNGNVLASLGLGSPVTSSGQVTQGVWNHVATSLDCSGSQPVLTVYLNGVQQGQVTLTTTNPACPNVHVFIGASGSNGAPTSCFTGMIGTVTAWNAVRDLDQIVDDSVQWEVEENANLVAYYDFTNLPAVERSGNNQPLALNGGAQYNICVPGLDLSQAPGANYAICYGPNSDVSLDGVTAYTIEGWFYPTQILSNALVGGSQAPKSPYYVRIDNNTLNSGRASDPAVEVGAIAALPANDYYHFATSYDGSVLRLYLNGNLQGATYSGAISSDFTDLMIGAMYTTDGIQDFFQGYIQNVRIWNLALNEADIRQWMYNDPVDDSDLIASFDFTVSPPVDAVGASGITLVGNAACDVQMTSIDPTSTQAQIGFLQPSADRLLQEVVQPISTAEAQPSVTVAPQVRPFTDEHFASLQSDLENNFLQGADPKRRADMMQGLQRAYKKASDMVQADPKLLDPFSTRVENGMT